MAPKWRGSRASTWRISAREAANGGAPVPGLHVVRPQLDDRGQKLDGQIEVLRLHGGLHAAHQEVCRIAAGGKPQRPDAIFHRLGAGVVGSGFQRLEQKIEVAHAVAALRLGQIIRRLHGRDGGRRTGLKRRRPRLRSRGHDGCRGNGGGQAQSGYSQHHGINFNSLDAGRKVPPSNPHMATELCRRSALARLVAAQRLIDHIDAALATHDPIVAVAAAQRFQRIADFHRRLPSGRARPAP